MVSDADAGRPHGAATVQPEAPQDATDHHAPATARAAAAHHCCGSSSHATLRPDDHSGRPAPAVAAIGRFSSIDLLSNRLRKASISHETFGLPGVYV